MSNPKTTLEDLANLGWPVNNILTQANAQRGNTMHGTQDVYINTGIAAQYQWWSYNTTIGTPYLLGSVPSSTSSDTTTWSYDNSENSESFAQSWTESWQDSTTATVAITNTSTITLSSSVTVFDVASSGIDLSFSTTTSDSHTSENSHNLGTTWNLNVGPYEKLSVVRTITTESQVATYGQDYGLQTGSLMGTNGSKWNGHYYWAFDLNGLLNYPKGRITIQGVARTTSYSFKLIRVGPSGTTETPLPVNTQAALVKTDASKPAPPAAVVAKWDAIRAAAAAKLGPTMIPGPAQ
ncbi:cytolysin [Trametes maxima]|nr:cytolysin [Trametes maxima]